MIFQSGHPAAINSRTRRSIYSSMLFDFVAISPSYSLHQRDWPRLRTVNYNKNLLRIIKSGAPDNENDAPFHQDSYVAPANLLCKSNISQLCCEHFWTTMLICNQRVSNSDLPHMVTENLGSSIGHCTILECCTGLKVIDGDGLHLAR